MAQERPLRLLGKLKSRLQEVPRQGQDVLTAVGERWQLEPDHVQAIKQVFPKAALADRLAQVGVRRGDDAYAGPACSVGSQTLELSGLQDSQELRLAAAGKIAELIEEQRAAIGGLEAPAAGAGPGEGAGLGAEQLGFDQLAGERAEIDLQVRLVAHRRVGLHDVG